MDYGKWDDKRLMREYLDLNKAGFCRIFGHNAKREQDIVSVELMARGISEIPNIFGAIPVRLNFPIPAPITKCDECGSTKHDMKLSGIADPICCEVVI